MKCIVCSMYDCDVILLIDVFNIFYVDRMLAIVLYMYYLVALEGYSTLFVINGSFCYSFIFFLKYNKTRTNTGNKRFHWAAARSVWYIHKKSLVLPPQKNFFQKTFSSPTRKAVSLVLASSFKTLCIH